MSLKIYMNGELVPKEEAKVSVYDHGLLYGDGVFEGIRAYSGKVFRLAEHVERLYQSARAIMLDIPIPAAQMAADIEKTVKANGFTDCYIRVVVTRGAGALGLDIRKTSHPQVIIIADMIQLYPPELYEKGLDIVSVSTIRNHPNALNPRIKSLNYLNNILAKIEGQLAGCVEALMVNHKGEVAECTGDNIFIVRKKDVLTPPLDAGILEGVTRNAVMEVARKAGYAMSERSMTRHDVYTADEVFLTGTAAEVIPVVKVDNRLIGTGKPGPIFMDIKTRFEKITRE
ncbi:branched-chain-amino-acid transaminase [bacterium]|jgi:branched-chain amino acid aminotransferase|nr:branched-chain-amino-acid transaminase [bacterium]